MGWRAASIHRRAAGSRKIAMEGTSPPLDLNLCIVVVDCVGTGGRGPGFRTSDFESARIIGQYQYEGARTIMGKSLASVSGPVKAVHVYLNMCVSISPLVS